MTQTATAQKPKASRPMTMNAALMRAELLRSLLDQGNRDLNHECNYPETITPKMYREMWDREGIGKRVVCCLPEESWGKLPDIYESDDPAETEFEAAWKVVQKKRHIMHYLQRIDELSGIGQFGIMLLGIDDGLQLNEPVEGIDENGEKTGKAKHELLYVRVFDQSVVDIQQRETNTNNPRYGQPLMYSVKFQDTSISGTATQQSESVDRQVHWTRVIHVADGRQMSEIFGTPRMQQVWNRLLDVRKVLGGSAEMFWKGGFPGFSFEVNPDLADAGVEIDEDKLRAQFEAYSNSMQRYMAMSGLQTKQLSPQVADPAGHVEAHLKAIAITLSVPYRILFGSEQGVLAGTQDGRSWNTRVMKRNNDYLTPMVVEPLIDRLIAFGVLPEPKEYKVDWPDLNTLTDAEKADVAVKRTQALGQYVQGGVDALVPPDAYMTHILEMTQDEVDAIKKAQDDQAAADALPEDGMAAEGGTAPIQGADGTMGALNGAQVQAAVAIVTAVTAGELPRASGIGQLMVFFALSKDQAEQVMGDAGTTVKVKPNPGVAEPPPGTPPAKPPGGKAGAAGGRPFEGVKNENPNHDELGRFAEGSGGEGGRGLKVGAVRYRGGQVSEQEYNDAFASLESRVGKEHHGAAEITDALAAGTHGARVVVLRDFSSDGYPIIGAVAFSEDQGSMLIHHLGSSGETKGIGKELVRHVLDAAVKKGVGVSFESTPNAEGFYEKLGFKHTDKEQSKLMAITADEAKAMFKSIGKSGGKQSLVKNEEMVYNFDPDQERDENGRWTAGGGTGSGGPGLPLPPKGAPDELKKLYRDRQNAYSRMRKSGVTEDQRKEHQAAFDQATQAISKARMEHPDWFKKGDDGAKGIIVKPNPDPKPEPEKTSGGAKPKTGDKVYAMAVHEVAGLTSLRDAASQANVKCTPAAKAMWDAKGLLEHRAQTLLGKKDDKYDWQKVEDMKQNGTDPSLVAFREDVHRKEEAYNKAYEDYASKNRAYMNGRSEAEAKIKEALNVANPISSNKALVTSASGRVTKEFKNATAGFAEFQQVVDSSAWQKQNTVSINTGVNMAKNDRSHCTWDGTAVNLKKGQGTKSTVIHEMGHALEAANPAIHKECLDFLSRRTQGEQLVSLRDVTGNKGYNADEMTRKDRFFDPYVGKEYNGHATEVLSMGIQRMLGNPVDFALQDPEHFRLTVRCIHGEHK